MHFARGLPLVKFYFTNSKLRKTNTSIAACLETCQSAERRPTIYSWLAYDILVLQMPTV